MTLQEQPANVTVRATLRIPDNHVWTVETHGHWSEENAVFMWTEGNYACDCNRMLFIWRSQGLSEDEIEQNEPPCGDAIVLMGLVNAETGNVLVAP